MCYKERQTSFLDRRLARSSAEPAAGIFRSMVLENERMPPPWSKPASTFRLIYHTWSLVAAYMSSVAICASCVGGSLVGRTGRRSESVGFARRWSSWPMARRLPCGREWTDRPIDSSWKSRGWTIADDVLGNSSSLAEPSQQVFSNQKGKKWMFTGVTAHVTTDSLIPSDYTSSRYPRNLKMILRLVNRHQFLGCPPPTPGAWSVGRECCKCLLTSQVNRLEILREFTAFAEWESVIFRQTTWVIRLILTTLSQLVSN